MPDYEKVDVDEVPNTPNPTRVKKEIDEALGVTTFGFNLYEADPGEQVPWGRHRHPNHEELFYVISGELAVETPEETYHVEAGEAFFVPPDHPNLARAVGDDPCRFIAVGAPKEHDEAIIEEECPHCGEVTDREYEILDDGDTYALYCAACGEETMRFSA